MWVFDATPLIYLAKAERLSYLELLGEPRLIPQRVYGEVVTDGLEAAYPDARRIQRHVNDGLFDVRTVTSNSVFERLEANQALSDADRAVLALAAKRDAVAVMDEEHGRAVARTEGISTRGTAYLVLSLVRDGHVDVREARTTFETMLDEGWYCSPNQYAKILEKLDSLGDA
jgi:predicted nucleic acid-binding protein